MVERRESRERTSTLVGGLSMTISNLSVQETSRVRNEWTGPAGRMRQGLTLSLSSVHRPSAYIEKVVGITKRFRKRSGPLEDVKPGLSIVFL